ncbi:MAG TPA: Ig-like domain repeat protein [Gemmatimonadales bacterium]|nr:Ig-like domain repeat protein [Gemmatimonadales bacterium]
MSSEPRGLRRPSPALLVAAIGAAAGAAFACGGSDLLLPGDIPAVTIAAVSGNGQTAPAGGALPAPLVVKATDGAGQPVAGLAIAWSVTGGGSLNTSSTATGADGRASVERILGPDAGTQKTTASADNAAGSPVTFTAIATAIELPAPTTTSITSVKPEPSTVFAPYTVAFTVTAAAPVGNPTGTVTVSDGSATCSASVADGQCALTPTTASDKTITASYAGDADHLPSSGSAQHHVDHVAAEASGPSSSDPVISQGQRVTFTTSVTPKVSVHGAPAPSGSVTFQRGACGAGGTLLSEKPIALDDEGRASFTTRELPVGTYLVVACYGGDSIYGAAASPGVPQTVLPKL